MPSARSVSRHAAFYGRASTEFFSLIIACKTLEQHAKSASIVVALQNTLRAIALRGKSGLLVCCSSGAT